jgi:hypothetical protein
MASGQGGGGVLPQGEGLRSALRWLDERVRDEPGADRAKLLAEASTRYDLTPLEEDFLLNNWLRKP